MQTRNSERNLKFWLLQAPGWLLLLYLIYAQAIPAFGYDIGVKMGTQEPVEMITEVGRRFLVWIRPWRFADLHPHSPSRSDWPYVK